MMPTLGVEMSSTIILIGPIGVGKTTQAKLLSHHLSLPRCSYDEVKGKCWKEQGLTKGDAEEIEREKGTYAMLSYMNEFKAETVASIVADHPGYVIDFGGGAQTFDEPHQVAKVVDAFEAVNNVFLLLPSPNVEESINALPGLKENLAINAYLIIHPTNAIYAKKTVFTLGKSSEQVMDEIIENLQST